MTKILTKLSRNQRDKFHPEIEEILSSGGDISYVLWDNIQPYPKQERTLNDKINRIEIKITRNEIKFLIEYTKKYVENKKLEEENNELRNERKRNKKCSLLIN